MIPAKRATADYSFPIYKTESFLYAPYGEIISEYNTHVMGEAFPKYSFNAKELDEETDFYYYEARYYAPPVFTSRDAMFEKYFWMSPYAYCANNPVKYVDPNGKEMWQPEIYENGKVCYVAEKGDSKESFQKQYNVSKEAVDKIFENAGVSDVKKGTTISGDVVAKSVTNNTGRKYDNVLKLNWNNATDKQKVYHTMFALLCGIVRKDDIDLNEFINGLPENTGDASCMRVFGLTQIPLINGERMNITVFHANFSKRFSKLGNPQQPEQFSNKYFGEQWNQQFTQPSDNVKKEIRRLLIGFEDKYYDIYTKSYYNSHHE
ncbi:MAG: RHS repeat-associated core domain-containing protein [Bacteroidales bacterium]|nr:RHS repeat-associated core domain-containing protein [Bacteroidales bacterium]